MGLSLGLGGWRGREYMNAFDIVYDYGDRMFVDSALYRLEKKMLRSASIFEHMHVIENNERK